MNPSPNLFLIGPMGAGKSTIGRRLAELLELPFVDLDVEIERDSGAIIPLIFEMEGETGFREREARLLEYHSSARGVVLGTGGGAILRPSNRAILMARGFVLWLNTGVETQWSRLARDRHRPLLQIPDPLARLREMATLRNPLYASCADLVWQSQGQNPGAAAVQLARLLPAHWHRETVPCA